MRAALLVLMLAGGAFAAAPPARLPAERLTLLRWRNALWKDGVAAWKAGKRAEAVTSLERVLTLELHLFGPWHRETEGTADRLGDCVNLMGSYEDVPKYRRMVVEARERLDGPGHWRAVDARVELEDARRHARRTAGEREKLVRMRAMNAAAYDLHLKGSLKEALPLAEQARALCKEVLGERHVSYATCLNNLASLHEARGDSAAALPLLRRALELNRDLRGTAHPGYATSLNNLALLHFRMGDHRAALPMLQNALGVWHRAHGEGHPDYAVHLSNLAGLYKELGDNRAALPLMRRALAVCEATLDRRHRYHLTCLNNLALLHHAMGDDKAALPMLRKELELHRETLGEGHPDYPVCLNNLAALHRDMGRPNTALLLYQRALEITRKIHGRGHPDSALCLNNLSLLYIDLGRLDAALPAAREVVTVRKEALGERHPHYATALSNLAAVYHHLNRPGAAVVLQEQALHLARSHLAQVSLVQSERQQLAAADAFRYHLNLRLSMADESARLSHAHVLSWKGAAFEAQRARRAFTRLRGDAATRRQADELLDLTRELALLSSRSDARSRGRLEELVRLRDEKEGRLTSRSEAYRAARTPPDTEAVRRLLPEGVVLVDWLAHPGLDPTQPPKGQKWGPRLSAWVLRADRPTVRVGLGPLRRVEEAISSWRRKLEAGDNSEEGVLLRRLVWAPLERHLAGARLVLLSPDGALSRLPFAALPGAKAGAFLLEEVPLAILPVPRLLPDLLRPAEGRPSLLTLGGADFDSALAGEPRARTEEGLSWPALGGTASEADAVAARYKGAKVTLSGKDATKPALRAALVKHRYAHLATHGYFAPASMRSALSRTDERPESYFHRGGVSGWHPALLSGLVLSGANRPTDEDDGVLTALEIAEMDLSDLELAVLSACETGLGEEAAGEGMLGLQRAFAVAGCKSVVSSLWSVHDGATAVLMDRFYHHLWEKKLSKLEALRQAQLDVLRHPEWVEERAKNLAADKLLVRGIGKASAPLPKTGERRSPPAWWAAWQLSGDWR